MTWSGRIIIDGNAQCVYEGIVHEPWTHLTSSNHLRIAPSSLLSRFAVDDPLLGNPCNQGSALFGEISSCMRLH